MLGVVEAVGACVYYILCSAVGLTNYEQMLHFIYNIIRKYERDSVLIAQVKFNVFWGC